VPGAQHEVVPDRDGEGVVQRTCGWARQRIPASRLQLSAGEGSKNETPTHVGRLGRDGRPGGAPASAQELPGPLATTHPCQDGYTQLVREDGSAFASPGDCVSYAARGGAVIEPLTGASCRLGLGPEEGADPQLIWTCSVADADLIERALKIAILAVVCDLAGDTRFSFDAGTTGPGQASCYRR
jgi:hypothetical protein